MSPPRVGVSGPFDDLRSRQVRFLEEASRWGPLTVFAWPDETILRVTGAPAKLPLAERLYLLGAIRYVDRALPALGDPQAGEAPWPPGRVPDLWVQEPGGAVALRPDVNAAHPIERRVLSPESLAGFPDEPDAARGAPAPSGRKKVIVTGCYDWFHSGHVRFFEEVSVYGDLYVVVGHDANIRHLKGPGHPLLRQDERRYMVASIRHVTAALVSSGHGWLDAEPEILRLKPDIYAVNEDGDKGGKREYCARHGIEYLVLRRAPAPGLARRTSTELRGF